VTAAPHYAIVVPAWNEEAIIGQTVGQLRTIAENLGRPYELVVVDDASSDRTAEIAAAAGARVVRVEKRQIAAVRNAGARATTAPFIVFCDADTWIPETVLRHALLELDRGAVGGGARVAFDGKGHAFAEACTDADLSVRIAAFHKNLGAIMDGADPLSPRSAVIASYALCGFANFASVGIQIGGIGGMAPNRMGDLAEMGLKAMIGGSLATFMTACVAGMFMG
jgi:glycosyltransferase involved in cell wall biosynthesis